MLDVIKQATFSELWSPGVLVTTILVAVLYLLLIGPWRGRFADSAQVSTWKKSSFLFGLLLIYITQGSPLSFLGKNYIFSGHMLGMAIDYLMFPPFILLGTPDWLIRPLLQFDRVKKVATKLLNPILALFVFNGLFSLFHIPLIFNLMDEHPVYHTLFHLAMLLSAFQMWMLVIDPLPELNRLSGLKKIGYIFANGVLLTPACALVTFASHTMYTAYMHYPVGFRWITPVQDQQLGGVIMKIVQEVVYGFAIAYSFFQWYKRERDQEKAEEEMSITGIHHGDLNNA